MCGIVGCIGNGNKQKIERMVDTLHHRGPNDRGIHEFTGGIFGHTRLSIVDVKGGHQPILKNEGKTGIICNGEIYNFKELAKEYLDGYDFDTQSDTEVILNLYRRFGPDAVAMLDGMFSFAIMDGDDFILARDPIGIKPLYYGYDDGVMYFSSELGAMSIANVNEVDEFPQGYYFTGKKGFVQYYSVPPVNDSTLTNIDDASKAIRETFIRSVKKRLLADPEVPVWILLLGRSGQQSCGRHCRRIDSQSAHLCGGNEG
ncbi:hypothetical protein [Marispirochaeta sp.]|uniref:hypothetical protein n=1 Tax=Marispirochaeta sp. TaxID=2038653 RepID=UPI0029C803EF|nr:hypothetical protein [Marispirochaeta sp.]